jgi:hypothetical protein
MLLAHKPVKKQIYSENPQKKCAYQSKKYSWAQPGLITGIIIRESAQSVRQDISFATSTGQIICLPHSVGFLLALPDGIAYEILIDSMTPWSSCYWGFVPVYEGSLRFVRRIFEALPIASLVGVGHCMHFSHRCMGIDQDYCAKAPQLHS